MEALFAWIVRIIQPLKMSRQIKFILLNARLISGWYQKDKRIPDKICVIKQIPKRDPKFQKNEIFKGTGSSINE